MFASLPEFVSHLEQRGQLLIVDREVDPRFELNAVVKKIQSGANLPVLFRRVRNTRFPVISNTLGNYALVSELLGVPIGKAAARWSTLTQAGEPTRESFSSDGGGGWEEISLLDLPQLVYCEKDAGPYLTAGVAICQDPDSKVVNLSYHRLQIVNGNELRGRLNPSGDLLRIQQRVEARGEALPVTIAIGMAPMLMLASATKVGPDRSEYEFAARLAGQRFPLVPSPLHGIPVPAQTEILLEGVILPKVRRPEGPFGEWMGYYVPVADNHVFEIKRAYARKDAVFYSITSGSREEHLMIALPIAGTVYSHVRTWIPSLLDATCYPYTQFCVLQIKKQFEGQPQRAMMAAYGSNLNHLLYCVVVDDDVNIHDWHDVLWAIGTRSRPDRTIVIPGVPSFPRDPHQTHFGRVGLDATKPLAHAGEFERKIVPGADDIRLEEYLAPSSRVRT